MNVINYAVPRIQNTINNIKSILLEARLKECKGKIKVWGPFQIKNPEKMIVGKNLSINDYVYINALGGITIGNDVSLSSSCMIISTKLDKKSNPFNLNHVNEQITISDNVQIGAGAIILPGVTIGCNCIIGAGAVVSKSIADNTIVAGIPATPIGKIY